KGSLAVAYQKSDTTMQVKLQLPKGTETIFEIPDSYQLLEATPVPSGGATADRIFLGEGSWQLILKKK
ncbi:MAG: hypothetical protein AAFO94_20915, partial [Bacteroidota bacterium]